MRKTFRALRYWISACVISIAHSLLLIGLVNAAETNRSLSDWTIQQRATEAVIWGMPAVNTLLMYDEMLKAGGKAGQIIYWGGPLTWRNQTLTPNPDTLYFMGFYDTKTDGPMVVEIPPAGADGSLNANIVTLWQTSLEDAGLLGVDKGAGAKFVITPPGFNDRIPDGFDRLPSDTFTGYFLVRSNLKSRSEADVQKSIAYAKRLKFYPLSKIENPPPTVFLDVKDKDFDSTIKYDLSFFSLLDRAVQTEPWIDRDRVMIDQLRSLDIEKGKAFSPNEATARSLEFGLEQARTFLAAKYDAGFPPFFEGTHWTLPAPPAAIKAQSTNYADANEYAVDARGVAYSYAYIGIKRLGIGQYYLINIKDKDGESYDGSRAYQLRVPANVPVEQYWSVTAYDRETHALIKGVDRASRASNGGDLKKNPDGSTDIFFGPKAPAGNESNWVPTDPARRFELMFRFYAPTKTLFGKAWKLPDVEKSSATMLAQTRSLAPSPNWALAMPSGPDARVKITEPFVRLVARGNYFWAWPMVNIYNKRLAFAEAPEPGLMNGVLPMAPLNRLAMLRDYVEPQERFVACPNQDVVYGGGALALDVSPVVIQVPDFGDRFWVYQAVDLRTDSFAQLGKMYGTTPGFYLFVGPNWQGDVPKGITKVFRSKTNTGFVAPRVFLDDTPQDRQTVQTVLQGIDMYPLAEYDGEIKRHNWSKLPTFATPGSSTSGAETRFVFPDKIFDQLPAVLADAPPLPGEEAHYAQILAVIAAAKKDPALMAAMIDEAAKTETGLVDPLLQFRNWGERLPHNWSSVSNGAAFGTDYFTRTAVAKSNILVNAPAETKYFYQDLDAAGARLNSAHRYTVTFAREQTPPVNGFWSLTLYDAQHFFAPNELRRYSLGTKNKTLQYNPDGSLTIYVQSDPPPEAQRSNWLPAPKSADFSLYIRAYWPKAAVLDGSWTPPAVIRANETGSRALQ